MQDGVSGISSTVYIVVVCYTIGVWSIAGAGAFMHHARPQRAGVGVFMHHCTSRLFTTVFTLRKLPFSLSLVELLWPLVVRFLLTLIFFWTSSKTSQKSWTVTKNLKDISSLKAAPLPTAMPLSSKTRRPPISDAVRGHYKTSQALNSCMNHPSHGSATPPLLCKESMQAGLL